MSRDTNDELRAERERQEERREVEREAGERIDVSQDEERHEGDARH